MSVRTQLYESELTDLNLMFLCQKPASRFRWGFGWRRVTLDELSRLTLSGTYRGIDVAAADGLLTHNALSDPTGGNLDMISGPKNGFNDETTDPFAVPDCLRLRGGYEVMFISGVALAPEQQIRNNSFSIKDDGSLIVHGGRLGLEFVY